MDIDADDDTAADETLPFVWAKLLEVMGVLGGKNKAGGTAISFLESWATFAMVQVIVACVGSWPKLITLTESSCGKGWEEQKAALVGMKQALVDLERMVAHPEQFVVKAMDVLDRRKDEFCKTLSPEMLATFNSNWQSNRNRCEKKCLSLVPRAARAALKKRHRLDTVIQRLELKEMLYDFSVPLPVLDGHKDAKGALLSAEAFLYTAVLRLPLGEDGRVPLQKATRIHQQWQQYMLERNKLRHSVSLMDKELRDDPYELFQTKESAWPDLAVALWPAICAVLGAAAPERVNSIIRAMGRTDRMRMQAQSFCNEIFLRANKTIVACVRAVALSIIRAEGTLDKAKAQLLSRKRMREAVEEETGLKPLAEGDEKVAGAQPSKKPRAGE